MVEAGTASTVWVAVIDDDEDVRQALGAILASAGYAIASHPDAEAFLAAPGIPPVACVVSDIQMPGIGGIELARRLNATRPDLPVVLISAFASEAMRRRASDAGALSFLEKPFEPDELLRTVAGLAGLP